LFGIGDWSLNVAVGLTHARVMTLAGSAAFRVTTFGGDQCCTSNDQRRWTSVVIEVAVAVGKRERISPRPVEHVGELAA
jgi:hypothetical protein